MQPSISVGPVAKPDEAEEQGPARSRTAWTEEHNRAIAAALFGSMELDATEEADPPEVRMPACISRWTRLR